MRARRSDDHQSRFWPPEVSTPRVILTTEAASSSSTLCGQKICLRPQRTCWQVERARGGGHDGGFQMLLSKAKADSHTGTEPVRPSQLPCGHRVRGKDSSVPTHRFSLFRCHAGRREGSGFAAGLCGGGQGKHTVPSAALQGQGQLATSGQHRVCCGEAPGVTRQRAPSPGCHPSHALTGHSAT